MTETTETFDQRMAREGTERVYRHVALVALVEDIARQLDPNAIVDGARTESKITLPGNFTFTISQDEYARGKDRDRLSISGNYEPGLWDYREYGVSMPEITVSGLKSAAQIARDIQRRFLPDFTAITTKMRERTDAAEARHNQNVVDAEVLAEISGGLMRIVLDYNKSRENPPKKAELTATSHAPFYGSVNVSDGTVSIKLISLTLQQAGDVLRALNMGQDAR